MRIGGELRDLDREIDTGLIVNWVAGIPEFVIPEIVLRIEGYLTVGDAAGQNSRLLTARLYLGRFLYRRLFRWRRLIFAWAFIRRSSLAGDQVGEVLPEFAVGHG
jgi:hypothetical protein